MKKLLIATVALLAPSTSGHAITLPDTITGDWCILEWANEQNSYHHVLMRVRTSEDCHVIDGYLYIKQDSMGGGIEGNCSYGKIEQEGPNAFLIYVIKCENNVGNGPALYEIIDGKLVISLVTES